MELVATGADGQTWRKRIPAAGKAVRLGRQPKDGWAVPWDVRISREHCDLEIRGDCLHVTVLEAARNAAYRNEQPVRAFSLGIGEEFRIGGTVFRVAPDTADEPAARPDEIKELWDKVEALRSRVKATAEARERLVSESTSPEPADPQPVPPVAAEKPAEKPTAKPAGKPSPADILAAARAKKAAAKAPDQPVATPSAKPAAETKPTPSVPPIPLAVRQAIWKTLPDTVRELVRRAAGGDTLSEAEQGSVVDALNRLVKDREFLSNAAVKPAFTQDAVRRGIEAYPKGAQGVAKDWSDLQVRAGGRLVLQSALPSLRQRTVSIQDPKVLVYMGRGEIFGEAGVLLKTRRSATCIAYDHPLDDPARKSGRVELVKIAADVFDDLVQRSPPFRQQLDRVLDAMRRRESLRRLAHPWDAGLSPATSPEFQELGLIQGQKLLLIDLDLCTRCGDCVRACVNTHDDGYSRLFLDGPRFDRFLVPSACRNCLNPSCMIGCPVGSIQRGEHGEILIRDWCIGCGQCAKQCPYGSIQMHDVGVLPTQTLDWRFAPQSRTTGDGWTQPRFRDSDWATTPSPFTWELEFATRLRGGVCGALDEAVLFRQRFDVPAEKLRSASGFRLLAESRGGLAVWVNGQPIELRQDAKQKKNGEFEADVPPEYLRPRDNCVAVRVSPPVEPGQTLLSLRVDAVPQLTGAAAETTELKLVSEKAVVCDLCQSMSSGRPACVDQCPHNAAMRVDARFEFPVVG